MARLRCVTKAAQGLSVTPSAVSHRIRQLETPLSQKLFTRGDCSLTVKGDAYINRIREAFQLLARQSGSVAERGKLLKLAVTPTFSRQILLPDLALFRYAYPDIELILQVAISLQDTTAEDADLEIRYGSGQYAGFESQLILQDKLYLTTKWTFDLKPNDIFWCTADIGRVTGHTYITYGPLALGGTEIVLESVPTYPDAGRFWKMIQDHKCTIFYTAPTAIRSLINAAESNAAVHPDRYDLSSLRILRSVGEPINLAAWEWYYKNIGGGRCPLVDTFWQTQAGGHMITPLTGATPLVPGSCTLPFPDIAAAIVDETGKDVPWGQGGILVVKKPWPSMIPTIWGDPERFRKSYYPEDFKGRYCLAGDCAIRDAKTGYFTIIGRIDDVLNVSGHRMGTMGIESALVSCTELVAEAAVLGRPDDTTGEAICAFVVLKRSRPIGDEARAIARQLRDWVGRETGPIAKPKDIRFGDNLPKTRSGKTMRCLLRSVAKGEAITQDTSTLDKPAIFEQFSHSNRTRTAGAITP